MKNSSKLLMVALFLAATVAAALAAAPAEKTITVSGYISASYDDDYNITGAAISTEDGVKYKLTLDAKGKELADDYEGEQVEATGTVVEKNGEKWLTVKSFKALEEEEDEEESQEETDQGW